MTWGHLGLALGVLIGTAGSTVQAQVIAGGLHNSLALREDGTVAAWGYNYVSGATSVTEATAVAGGGYHSLALREDGTVAAWGVNYLNQVSGATSVTDATAIAGGFDHSLALREDGTVAAWGYNYYNQVSGATPVTEATAVAGGGYHSLALREDGTVAAWGWDNYNQVSGATNYSDVVAISAGFYHNLAVLSDGSVVGWGRNSDGQVNIPSDLTLPTTVRWSEGVDGNYLEAHRWSQKTPSTAKSDAFFEASGDYTVEFGNTARARNLEVSAGEVAFNLGSHGYQVENNVDITGGAKFTQNGTLTAQQTIVQGNSTFTNQGLVDSNLTVQAGSTFINNGSHTGSLNLYGELAGAGSLGDVTLAGGSIVGPGNSPGTLEMASLDWDGNSTYQWEIDSAGFHDLIAVDGIARFNATSSAPITLELLSLGALTGWDSEASHQWTILTAGQILGFDASAWYINTTGFENFNSLNGSFSVWQDGNSLALQYTNATNPVPEPGSLVLMATAGLMGGIYLRRKKKREAAAC